jgi:hypothetical protein
VSGCIMDRGIVSNRLVHRKECGSWRGHSV